MRLTKPRRWFSGPRLIQWRYMQQCGQYTGPFATFPDDPLALVESGIPSLAFGGRFNMKPRGSEGWSDQFQAKSLRWKIRFILALAICYTVEALALRLGWSCWQTIHDIRWKIQEPDWMAE